MYYILMCFHPNNCPLLKDMRKLREDLEIDTFLVRGLRAKRAMDTIEMEK